MVYFSYLCMIESLENYRQLVSINQERYEDTSGLFEIIESIFIQLSQSNPIFNAYVDYLYLNVVHGHIIEISKLLDLEGNKIRFSEILLSCNSRGDYFEIFRTDFENNETSYTESRRYEFGYTSFNIIFDYISNWFSEILIRVNNNK